MILFLLYHHYTCLWSEDGNVIVDDHKAIFGKKSSSERGFSGFLPSNVVNIFMPLQYLIFITSISNFVLCSRRCAQATCSQPAAASCTRFSSISISALSTYSCGITKCFAGYMVRYPLCPVLPVPCLWAAQNRDPFDLITEQFYPYASFPEPGISLLYRPLSEGAVPALYHCAHIVYWWDSNKVDRSTSLPTAIDTVIERHSCGEPKL